MKDLLGVALVSAGALLLIIAWIVGWTTSNLVLLSGLILMIMGLVAHIKGIKNGQKY